MTKCYENNNFGLLIKCVPPPTTEKYFLSKVLNKRFVRLRAEKIKKIS